MRSIPVVVIDDISQVPLANRDDAIKALSFDRSYESFCVRVQVRAPRRKLNRLNPICPEHVDHGLGEEWVAVVDQVLVISQETIEVIELLTKRVAHPLTVWPIADSHNLDMTSRQIDHKEHIKRVRPFLVQASTVKKSIATSYSVAGDLHFDGCTLIVALGDELSTDGEQVLVDIGGTANGNFAGFP